MTVTKNSITYSVLNEVIDAGLSVGRMMNSAGMVVEANPSTVGKAVLEKGSDYNQKSGALIVDPFGSGAWPMSTFSYILFRQNVSPESSIQ